MKIAILTQRIGSNYGGILQNFALQETLRRMGYESITLDRTPKKRRFLRDVGKYIVQELNVKSQPFVPTYSQNEYINKNLEDFVSRRIQIVRGLTPQSRFDKYVSDNRYDAYIVGSDQVWRPCYSPKIENFFLDFASDWRQTKKIAYAASFGTDEWEYSQEQTERCRKLSSNFSAISVREDSAVLMCKKYLNVDAIHVLDPTLLLSPEDYRNLYIEPQQNEYAEGVTLSYILDEDGMGDILQQVHCLRGNKKMVSNNAPRWTWENKNELKKCQRIKVEEWLRNIDEADFLVTDSFHGTVFALLFKTPFMVLQNEQRGNARIESLLRMFGLEARMVKRGCQEVEDFVNRPINWEKIENELAIQKEKSYEFIKESLS